MVMPMLPRSSEGYRVADNQRLPDVSEIAFARPGLCVGKAQLDAREVFWICQPHVHAHHAVAVLGNGSGGEQEVGGGAACRAKVDLRVGIFLVAPGICGRPARDRDFGMVKVAPARAGLAAQGAVAFVDELGRPLKLDADLAAEAGEVQPVVVGMTNEALSSEQARQG